MPTGSGQLDGLPMQATLCSWLQRVGAAIGSLPTLHSMKSKPIALVFLAVRGPRVAVFLINHTLNCGRVWRRRFASWLPVTSLAQRCPRLAGQR